MNAQIAVKRTLEGKLRVDIHHGESYQSITSGHSDEVNFHEGNYLSIKVDNIVIIERFRDGERIEIHSFDSDFTIIANEYILTFHPTEPPYTNMVKKHFLKKPNILVKKMVGNSNTPFTVTITLKTIAGVATSYINVAINEEHMNLQRTRILIRKVEEANRSNVRTWTHRLDVDGKYKRSATTVI